MNYYRIRNPTSRATLSYRPTEDALSKLDEKGFDFIDEAQATTASNKLQMEELVENTNYLDSSSNLK